MRSMLRRNRNNSDLKLCNDCGRDVEQIKQYFMVNDDIWQKYGNKEGFLCMDCLEKRIGYKLLLNDFKYEIINSIYLSFNRERHIP